MVTGKRLLWAALAALLLIPVVAPAQNYEQHGPFDTNAGSPAAPQGTPSAPFYELQSGVAGATAITPGTAFTASRAIYYVCTSAGNVTVTLLNGSTMTFPIAVSATLQTLPFEATNLSLGSGTAGTFWSAQ